MKFIVDYHNTTAKAFASAKTNNSISIGKFSIKPTDVNHGDTLLDSIKIVLLDEKYRTPNDKTVEIIEGSMYIHTYYPWEWIGSGNPYKISKMGDGDIQQVTVKAIHNVPVLIRTIELFGLDIPHVEIAEGLSLVTLKDSQGCYVYNDIIMLSRDDIDLNYDIIDEMTSCNSEIKEVNGVIHTPFTEETNKRMVRLLQRKCVNPNL